LDLAYILKTLVEHRFAARDTPITVVHKNIGYELRSASPIAFDCEYVRTLGYGAVEFFLSRRQDAEKLTGALICLVDGKLQFLDFADLLDPKTGKSLIRVVDVNKPSYKIAREYMIRLEREDLEDKDKLRVLAEAASSQSQRCSPDEFRTRFQHLLDA
jgi:6-phosphofructokinase 1